MVQVQQVRGIAVRNRLGGKRNILFLVRGGNGANSFSIITVFSVRYSSPDNGISGDY